MQKVIAAPSMKDVHNRVSLLKGDLPGHPFRGNQYTGGNAGNDMKGVGGNAPGGHLAYAAKTKSGKFIAHVRDKMDRIVAHGTREFANPEDAKNHGIQIAMALHRGAATLPSGARGRPAPGNAFHSRDKIETTWNSDGTYNRINHTTGQRSVHSMATGRLLFRGPSA